MKYLSAAIIVVFFIMVGGSCSSSPPASSSSNLIASVSKKEALPMELGHHLNFYDGRGWISDQSLWSPGSLWFGVMFYAKNGELDNIVDFKGNKFRYRYVAKLDSEEYNSLYAYSNQIVGLRLTSLHQWDREGKLVSFRAGGPLPPYRNNSQYKKGILDVTFEKMELIISSKELSDQLFVIEGVNAYFVMRHKKEEK